MSSNKYILVINGGSSSLKFSLYERSATAIELTGEVARIGEKDSYLEISNAKEVIFKESSGFYETLMDGVKALTGWLIKNKWHHSIEAIGHRLVQGGPEHREPELINEALLQALHEYVYLAPNHLPNEIKTIKLFRSAFPDIPQVACFDTNFHRHLPSYAKYYPIVKKYTNKGLMRYGFHGLSYEYILEKLVSENPDIKKQKIIIAHLGNGASMAAIINGIGIDTTMGLSPAGGLVMGTRTGDLDPGVILFLLKQAKLSTAELDELLNKESGLKAIAGTSDLQQLLKNEADDPKAKEALTVFCYAAKKFIGSLAAAMGGIDLLVFTGGIGANAATIRERICENLDFMGIQLDKKLNKASKETISSAESIVIIKAMKTNEEFIIVKHTRHIIDQIPPIIHQSK